MFTTRGTLSRRRLLALAGVGAAGVVAAACTGDSSPVATTGAGPTTADTTATAPTGTTGTAASTATTTAIDTTPTPDETAGPFPADGSNDNGAGAVADVRNDPRAVRRDIRGDLDGSNVQEGAPFEFTMRVVDASGAALPGAAVYVWHCNRDGNYSAYDSRMLDGSFAERSFLRGVQVTDDAGDVTFTSILPGRYPGRAFHIHFEIFEDASMTTLLLTSQMAIDDDTIDALYAALAGYEASLGNDTDNADDGVFADGVEHQLMTMSGDPTSGLRATFTAVV